MDRGKRFTNVVQEKNEHRSQRPATTARRDELAARLIALATAVIAGEGIQELRARSLAEAAGCSVGAIYGVFPDLDELILAVNTRTLDAIDAAMAAAVGDAASPAAQMARLAAAYLDYAICHSGLWGALFQHQMSGGRALPAWYTARLEAAFAPLAAPVGQLLPDLAEAERARLARTLFSAVHGVVALGLGTKATALPPPLLHGQLRIVVEALARGLETRSA